MKRISLYLFFLCMALLTTAMVMDADIVEVLKKKLFDYTHEKPTTSLYLHTDKSVYAPGESLWFKAYVLSGTVTDSKVIYVRLADRNKRLIISDQFPMDNLLGNGELLLPDSLREGDYTLYAYTDRMINFSDHDIFTQPVHIIKSVSGGMVAEAAVADTTKLRPGQEVSINVKVHTGNELVNGIKGAYRLYAGGQFIKGGKLTTNSSGETHIGFIYPQLLAGQSLRVNINFNREDDRTELNLNLPPADNQVIVSVYAEGGQILAGVPVNLAIKAADINNNPVSTTVLLKKGEKEIKQIQTNADGMGMVNLIPASGSAYTLKLADNNKITHLPKTGNKGYSFHLSPQKNKTLRAVIYNKGENGNALLVLRNYESILWSKEINLASADSVSVDLPANDLPKDVLNLALFDQKGNLRGERLFLNKAGENENYNLDIRTNEQEYGTRKKVTVTLSVTDNNGKPVQANLSTAAVTAGRTDISNYRNILQAYKYRFLKTGKSGLAITPNDEKNINDILLIARWENAAWPEVIAYKLRGERKLIANTDGIKGVIEPKGDNIRITGWQLQVGTKKISMAINANGTFNIPSEALLINRGIDLQWAGGEKFKENYRISYKNEDVVFDNRILAGDALNVPGLFNAFTTIETKTEDSKFGLNIINALGEIKIRSGVSSVGDFWSANCDDYACENDILNCPLHPPGSAGNHKPEQGKVYSIIDIKSQVNRHVIYRGCSNIWNMDLPKNVYIPLKFNAPDYDLESPAESQLMSTVYWNPNINTDAGGKATFSFYTSDIKGDYRVIVQGVKNHTTDPLYGTVKFTVK